MFGGSGEILNTVDFPAPNRVDHRWPATTGRYASTSTDASEGGQSVFLHTGWRSGGTWIWSRCRENPRVHGYYEPLHEHAATFRRRDVEKTRPGSWKSNHSETAPYFQEYRALIPPRGRGVSLYQTRFAFDDFFLAPHDPGDAELEAYIASLLALPLSQGKLPVLKFCRSMGRVGWFEQRFPQALHAVVLRDPIAQFRSGQRLLQEQRNRYFALAPLLVLARNAHDPRVRTAASALGVNLPTLYSDDMDYAVETCGAHVRRAAPAERYRGFLAFWTLSALSALDSEALVIDADAMDDLAHRSTIEQALQARIGEPIRLVPRVSPAAKYESLPVGLREAHDEAAAFVRAHHGGISAQRIDIILEKLGGDEAALRMPPSWRTPHLPAPIPSPSITRRATTWLEVRLARAMQPLRRLHGSIAKRESA
jgi:hypothetical protein